MTNNRNDVAAHFHLDDGSLAICHCKKKTIGKTGEWHVKRVIFSSAGNDDVLEFVSPRPIDIRYDRAERIYVVND